MLTVGQWLEALGLPQYEKVFAENDVDLEALRLLAENDLEKLGVSLGHRKKLLKAAAGLDDALAPESAPTFQASPPNLERESFGAEGERRQLTVLFCDMVGFTELATRVDPEVLQRIIRSYEDTCAVCITRYEGYVFQRLGDGIVAFFGYPLAHEGEAERAVRAGLEIIEALSRLDVPDAGHLAVRIGIATGVVVVSSAQKGAVGETMNLAARLQAIAQPGSIVVSERVRRLSGGSFDYQDLGEQTLKGIASPTHAFRILGVRQAASRFEAAHPEGLTLLVGREREIRLLMERWMLAQDGEGQVVLLSGEPGIGKSRLVGALRERLEGQGAQALIFQCSPYHVNSAFWPLIDNFERKLNFARDESTQAKLDKLETLIVTEYGRPKDDVRFVATLLSLSCDERHGPLPTNPQTQKSETLRTLIDLVEVTVRRDPSVLLFEDVHWADPSTLEVLDLLIERARGFPILIVLTHRPEFQSRWSRYEYVTALSLSKLTRSQGSALVSEIAGRKTLPSEVMEQIMTKADGVPLFLEELTKSILESGELKVAGHSYEHSAKSQGFSIPATLRDSLMARLDRIMPVKEIAQIGAAIGRQFSYQLLSAVTPMNGAALDSGLQRLTESGLAFRRGNPPEAQYTFKHALVQDAAYDSLLKSRRAQVHAGIAQALEEKFPNTVTNQPEVVAHHYMAAGMPEQAIGYWQRAGELAHTRIALHEAIAHLQRGLDAAQEIPPSPPRDRYVLDLRAMLGMACLALHGWAHPSVAEHLEPAYALEETLTPGEHSLRVLWGLWVYRLATGRTRLSLPMAEALLAQGQLMGDEEMLQAGLWALVTTHYWLGHFEKSIEYADVILEKYDLDRHRPLADALNHDPKTVALQYKAASLGQLGYPDSAALLMQETLEHARARGHAFDYAWALYFAMAELYAYRNDASTIEMLLAEFEPFVREKRLLVFEQLFGPYCRAIRDLLLKMPESASQALRALIPGSEAAGLGQVVTAMKTWQAQAALLASQRDLPLILVNEALAQIMKPECGLEYLHAEVLRIRGLVLQASGKFDDAEEVFCEAIDLARSQRAKWWELRIAISLAQMWQGRGREKEACKLLAPIYGWFTEGFDTEDLMEAKALLDTLNVT